MSDKDAFLRAICAAPDEDTPRLAFADFLQERGNAFDTAWAACIRAQVQLAAGPPDAAAEKRVRLISTPFFREQWLKRLGLNRNGRPYWGARWDRGFIADLSCDFHELRKVRAGFADRVPFRQLEVALGTPGDLEEVAAWPEVARLTSLTLSTHEEGRELTDRHAAVLANCAALSGLVGLHLRYVAITDRGASDLLSSIALRGVRELSLVWTGQAGETLSRAVRRKLADRFGPHCLR